MKIIEKKTDIEIKGAKLSTANRPENLSKFLNYVNTSLIIGLPASGKSSLIKTLLNGTKKDNLYNNVFHSVYYISPSITMDLNIPEEKYLELSDDQPLELLIEEIIDNEKGLGEEDEPHHVAIFLDDAVAWLNSKKEALKTFKKIAFNGRHILGPHSSLQTFLVSQKIKSIPTTIRSMANQIWFFNSTKSEKSVLQEEFLPLDKQDAELIYNHVFDEPHNFLFVNLQMPINERMFKNFNQLTILK